MRHGTLLLRSLCRERNLWNSSLTGKTREKVIFRNTSVEKAGGKETLAERRRMRADARSETVLKIGRDPGRGL
jgi:hypothetical protein